MQPRHFTSLLDLSSTELRDLIKRAIQLKNYRDPDFQPLKGKSFGHDFRKIFHTYSYLL